MGPGQAYGHDAVGAINSQLWDEFHKPRPFSGKVQESWHLRARSVGKAQALFS